MIRTATPDDLDKIVDLHAQARTAYYKAGGLSGEEIGTPDAAAWARVLRSPERTVYCAVQDGSIVGVVAMGQVEPAVGQLLQIHVMPGHWGQGTGSRLHESFVQFLNSASLTAGRVEAWSRNNRAQAFYARHGWLPDGHRRPGPGDADYVRMSLDPTAATAWRRC